MDWRDHLSSASIGQATRNMRFRLYSAPRYRGRYIRAPLGIGTGRSWHMLATDEKTVQEPPKVDGRKVEAA